MTKNLLLERSLPLKCIQIVYLIVIFYEPIKIGWWMRERQSHDDPDWGGIMWRLERPTPGVECPLGWTSTSRAVQGEEQGQDELSGYCKSILDPYHYFLVIFNWGESIKWKSYWKKNEKFIIHQWMLAVSLGTHKLWQIPRKKGFSCSKNISSF